MTQPVTRYVVALGASLPKKWRDARGPIQVMSEPVQGYVMARRPGRIPFVLTLRQLLNAEKHPTIGPFELVESDIANAPLEEAKR